jgi:quinol-cytochrome oxidoreductase complex cytochrome b subunit
MKVEFSTIFLFLFILSCVYVLNLIVKVVVSIIQTPPKQLEYSSTEKINNYLTITYILTYLIQQI